MLKSNFLKITLAAATLLTSVSAIANDTSLTIYSQAQPGAVDAELYRPTGNYSNYSQIPGYAMIRQQREITLDKPRSKFRLDDVAALIDPTTVAFKSLTDPKNTKVLEQNYNFDLVSINKLAQRYLGKEISFEKKYSHKDPLIITGTLLSAQNNQLVVQKKDGSIVSTYNQQVTFPKLPGELFTKPTLIWDILTEKLGKHDIEVSYQTEGITWWADYNATYSDGAGANDGFLDLGAWVSIVNKTGASFRDAKLKLIAGDVNKIQSNRNDRRILRKHKVMSEALFAADTSAAGFEQKAFFEFHLYTLGRPTTILDNSTKQIELFPKAINIPVEKIFTYYGASSDYNYYSRINYDRNWGTENGNKKVNVYLKFKNDEAKGLGIPLPSGRIRVSKRDDADDSLEFIGEDIIDHTPRNEKVLIKLGNAFDIVGERKQTNFFVDHARKYLDETFEIKLRNHKDKTVKVLINEALYRGANWKILNNNSPYKKQNSQLIQFPIAVAKDSERVISYTVRYNWK